MNNSKSSKTVAISVEFNESELEMIMEFVESNNLDISEVIRNATLDKIENDLDVMVLEAAMERFQDGSRFYSLDDVGKDLGF